MTVPERDDEKQNTTDEASESQELSSEEISERIGEALEPALSEISVRVAEAVTQNLAMSSSSQGEGSDDEGEARSASAADAQDRGDPDSESQDESGDEESDSDSQDSKPEPSEGDSTDDQSFIGQASHALFSSFISSMRDGQSGSDSESQDDSADEESSNDSEDSKPARSRNDDSGDRTLAGQASQALLGSFVRSMREEGGEQLEALIEQAMDMLFSRRGQAWIRRLADQTLQASLHDMLKSIDDPTERSQAYRENLAKLRPIVRQAVDAMFTEDARHTLQRELRGAIPSLLHGEFGTAFSMIVDALSDVTDYAEEVLWDNSYELLSVMQHISTTLLQESIEDAVEDKFDPEEIQQKMQGKVEEAREKLQEKVGSLQESVQGAQSQLGSSTGGLGGRGKPGMPPSGKPPFGVPSSGMPPSGMPPSGRPPFGGPPSGARPHALPPAAERRLQKAGGRSGNPRTRRTPER